VLKSPVLHHQVADQKKQDNDERDGDIAHLRLPRYGNPLQLDALVDVLLRPFQLGLCESELLLVRAQGPLLGLERRSLHFGALPTRVSIATQLTSQVLPSSSEKACSKRHDVAVMSEMTKRSRMGRPLNVSLSKNVPRPFLN